MILRQLQVRHIRLRNNNDRPMKNILLTFIACGCTCCLQAMSNPTDASAGGAKKNKPEAKVPLVYPVEHTGSSYALPSMPTYDGLPEVRNLPDPLEWSNGSGRVASFADWSRRRSEIAAEIQHYGIGTKPSVPKDAVHAYMDADTLVVNVTVNGHTLRLRSEIRYPKTGQPPYALMIGTSGIALPKQLFEGRPIATMVFHEDQVNDYSQWRKHKERGQHNFDRLYPQLKDNGAYSEWAWGLSRLIDGLQQLGPATTTIDMNHIGGMLLCREDGALLRGFRRAHRTHHRAGTWRRRCCGLAHLASDGQCGVSGKDRLSLVSGEHEDNILRRQCVPNALRPS